MKRLLLLSLILSTFLTKQSTAQDTAQVRYPDGSTVNLILNNTAGIQRKARMDSIKAAQTYAQKQQADSMAADFLTRLTNAFITMYNYRVSDSTTAKNRIDSINAAAIINATAISLTMNSLINGRNSDSAKSVSFLTRYMSDSAVNTTARHTHPNKSMLDLLSGTNTGDETAATIKSKLGITNLSGNNSGDQDLSSYETITAHTNSLTNYPTNTSLATTLGGYVTSGTLSTTLSGYPTNSSLTTTLGGYTTNSSLATTLGSYSTTSGVNTLISNALSPYSTTASINTTLGGYTTTGALTSALAPYSTAAVIAANYTSLLKHTADSNLFRYTFTDRTKYSTDSTTNKTIQDANTAARHTHTNITALNAVSGVNTGDQDLSGLTTKTKTQTDSLYSDATYVKKAKSVADSMMASNTYTAKTKSTADSAAFKVADNNIIATVNALEDSIQHFNSSNVRVRQIWKHKYLILTPTTGNGYTVDISGLGYTYINAPQYALIHNTATTTDGLLLEMKSFTATSLVFNLRGPVAAIVGAIGLGFVATPTNTQIAVDIWGY